MALAECDETGGERLMVYARKVDAPHAAIRKALRKIGVTVYDASRIGGGFPDLVCLLGFRLLMLEVKRPGGKLTPEQEQFHRAWSRFVRVVESPEEAIRVMTL